MTNKHLEKDTRPLAAQVQNFVAFGESLRRVHARLLMEGYIIWNGKAILKKFIEDMSKTNEHYYNANKLALWNYLKNTKIVM
jgi:hypothetical protein